MDDEGSEYQRRLLKVLTERGVHGTCRRCERADMDVTQINAGFMVSAPGPDPFPVGKQTDRVAVLQCPNCGAVELYNLAVLGL